MKFQWSHFFSEMDREPARREPETVHLCFNGATSFQKWIDEQPYAVCLSYFHVVSMEPLLFRNG